MLYYKKIVKRKNSAPNTILFANDIVLVQESLDELKTDLMVTNMLDNNELKISIKKADLLAFNFSKRDVDRLKYFEFLGHKQVVLTGQQPMGYFMTNTYLLE